MADGLAQSGGTLHGGPASKERVGGEKQMTRNEWAWTEPIYTSGIEDEEKRKEREEKKKRKEKKKKSSLDVLLSPPRAGHRASSPRAPSVSGAVGEVVNPLLVTTVN